MYGFGSIDTAVVIFVLESQQGVMGQACDRKAVKAFAALRCSAIRCTFTDFTAVLASGITTAPYCIVVSHDFNWGGASKNNMLPVQHHHPK